VASPSGLAGERCDSQDWKPSFGYPRDVGVAWQASCWSRSFPLALFTAIAEIPGVQLFSLQRGHGTDLNAAGFPVTDLEDGPADILATAAHIAALDLMIVPDTMLAHLAAALERPVCMIAPSVSEWRWMERERTDSPWYPSLKIVRQPAPGDWAGAVAEVVEAIRGFQARRTESTKPP
jgi:hypothetical protein